MFVKCNQQGTKFGPQTTPWCVTAPGTNKSFPFLSYLYLLVFKPPPLLILLFVWDFSNAGNQTHSHKSGVLTWDTLPAFSILNLKNPHISVLLIVTMNISWRLSSLVDKQIHIIQGQKQNVKLFTVKSLYPAVSLQLASTFLGPGR